MSTGICTKYIGHVTQLSLRNGNPPLTIQNKHLIHQWTSKHLFECIPSSQALEENNLLNFCADGEETHDEDSEEQHGRILTSCFHNFMDYRHRRDGANPSDDNKDYPLLQEGISDLLATLKQGADPR